METQNCFVFELQNAENSISTAQAIPTGPYPRLF